MEPNTTLEPPTASADLPSPTGTVPAGPTAPPPVGYPPYAPPTPPRRSGPPWYAWAVGAVLGVFLLAAAACVAFAIAVAGVVGYASEQQDTVARTFAVGAAPSVAVRNVTGNITIGTGADGTVAVQVIRRARDRQTQAARDDLRQIVVNASQNGDAVLIAIQYPSNAGVGRMLSADIHVTLPQGTNLDVEGVTGNIAATGVHGTLAVRLVTGNVDVRAVTLAGASRAELTTGALTFDGALAAGASLDAQVVTGRVALTLPADTPARLQADTVTGDIGIHGWPIPVTGTLVSHHASGALGQPATGTVAIAVTTGSIEVIAR